MTTPKNVVEGLGSLEGIHNEEKARAGSCKAPDVVLTLTSCFRVRSELEAHQTPPAHDTRTRVATGFSTTSIRNTTLQDINIDRIDRAGHTTPLSDNTTSS